MSIGIKISIDAIRGGLIDSQASAFYDRVIADGGVVPTGLVGVSATFKAIKAIYGVTDITAAISVFYDAHYLGYKLGTGTGTTLGQACAKLYSACGASGDCVQATLASQPLLLAWSSTIGNYWYNAGISANYCSSPNAVANQITGDVEIISQISLQSITSYISFISKFNGNIGFIFNQTNTGKLEFYATLASGNIDAISTVSHGFAVRTIFYVKVTRQSSSGDVKFYTSTDGINYTQLGTTITGTSGNLNLGSSSLNCGCDQNGINNILSGKIYRATIANSIGGTPVVDFNPASYNAATSQTQWTSTTGEVWTINTGTATTGYKGVLVDWTIIQGDGTDDSMISGTITTRQFFTSYSAARIFEYTAEQPMYAANSASHLLYTASGSLAAYNGGNVISGNSSVLLNCQTVDFNSSTSKIRINAGADTTGNSGLNTSTNVKMFEYGGTVFGNGILQTLIQSKSLDTDTQKTAMYNAIKSFNNNAF